MNRRAFVISTLAGAVGLTAASRLAAQKKMIAPDLAALADGKGFQLLNRGISRFTDGATSGARLTAAPGEGVALLPGIEFGDGTIECDLRGKDVPLKQLSDRRTGLLGLWVGNASGGDFANLTIVPA
ncbi:MAG: hypothetical protein HY048_09680 [Acidobacteria bacterium]|nr:hypothetical protein [Acidobacteriota bacterium]